MDGKRIAIITGATSGLGLEFARQLDAKNRAHDRSHDIDEFWLVARDSQRLDEVAAALDTPSYGVAADLSKPEDIAHIAALLASGRDVNGREDVHNEEAHSSAPTTSDRSDERITVTYLVNCAGFGRFGSWRDIADTDAATMIDLDYRAVVALTRACLPHMNRGSRIIEVASSAAFLPLPYMNVYAATKAAVLRYTRALRWELHGTGITATALCPTWVKTGFEKRARKSDAPRAVNHLLFAQSAKTVVRRALLANRAHFAVACCSIPALFLRVVGKIVPSCISMLGWNYLRRL